jgi:tartrate-resistant acid phosphatase type 5
VQVNFLNQTFAASNATWKFLQLHHPYMSVSTNETDLAPLIKVVEAHNGIVINGHDHCLGHFFNNNTNFILSGAAGYPQAGDCNNGVPLGPYALYLAANNLTGKSSTSSLRVTARRGRAGENTVLTKACP